MKQRGDNIYLKVGLERGSSIEDIDNAQMQYVYCLNMEPECTDPKMKGQIYKLSEDEVRETFFVLKKDNLIHMQRVFEKIQECFEILQANWDENLREIYDKSETFIRQKQLKKTPSDGMRYFDAFSELKHYAMFVIISFMLIE